jgi:hypothetical protein
MEIHDVGHCAVRSTGHPRQWAESGLGVGYGQPRRAVVGPGGNIDVTDDKDSNLRPKPDVRFGHWARVRRPAVA